MEKTVTAIPIVTESIRIDTSLHVQLHFKECTLPLPSWFRNSRSCKLVSFAQLENFPAYIRTTSENISGSVFKELQKRQFIMRGCYSASLVRYALMLRYTSLQFYKLLLKEFNLPSVSYLRKLKLGNINIIKSAKMLLEFNSISKDVILMFVEMYL